MKNIKCFSAILFFLLCTCLQARSAEVKSPEIQGGWSLEVESEEGNLTHILLFSGQYFSWTVHKTESGAFISTKGGSWSAEGDQLQLMYEFHTEDPEKVGKTETVGFLKKKGQLQLGNGRGAWKPLDSGLKSPLTGAWLISGRKVGEEIRSMDTSRPRKTMKILTPGRFQWIAYNTETGDFFGTGGGSYTAEDGKYVEHIEFFSRDDNRVGASLEFDFEVKNGDWIHSGKSSSGKPLYEVWSKR